MVAANSARASRSASARAEIDEDHVPPREQLGVRTKHRVQRGDRDAGLLQRRQPGTQWRLERAEVEHDAARPPRRKFAEDGVGGAQRRRHHDQILVERRRAPVGDAPETNGGLPRVRDLHHEPLRTQELRKPSPHLAGTADHQRTAATARSLGRYAGALLRGQRGPDQQPHHGLGHLGRHAELLRVVAGAEQHVAFATVIAGRKPGRALDPRNLPTLGLSCGNNLQQLLIQLIQLPAELVEIHGGPCLIGAPLYRFPSICGKRGACG